MSVFPAVFQFSPGCDRVMAAVQWTGSTLTGLPVQIHQFWELVLTVITGIIGTYGVYMNIGRVGIPNGVSGRAEVVSLGVDLNPLFLPWNAG